MKRIILAGGSGFLGQSLAATLLREGYEVVVLSRTRTDQQDNIRYLQWDARTLGDWAGFIEGSTAVVNLAGKSINCRHTASNRREIVDSRINAVRVLGEAIKQSTAPPRAFVQASAVGVYGNTGDRWCDEQAPHGEGFMVEVCDQWERASEEIKASNLRISILRIGFALGPGGGALEYLARLTRCFLGGHIGTGRQFISWIHVADLNRMFLWAIEREKIRGMFNATSPSPVTNAEFMDELRWALRRPWSPPVPALAAYVGAWVMRTEASLALTGQRCEPQRFRDEGFVFEFPNLRVALADVYPTILAGS
jgi:uncharacterized protein (TIGR01777 family)